jgi:anti-sigma factor RsiW
MTSAELTCQELVELVTDYLEGALSTSERVRLEEHLATCPSCPAYLEQMRRTIRTLGILREDSIGPEARHELLRLFRDWKRG